MKRIISTPLKINEGQGKATLSFIDQQRDDLLLLYKIELNFIKEQLFFIGFFYLALVCLSRLGPVDQLHKII